VLRVGCGAIVSGRMTPHPSSPRLLTLTGAHSIIIITSAGSHPFASQTCARRLAPPKLLPFLVTMSSVGQKATITGGAYKGQDGVRAPFP